MPTIVTQRTAKSSALPGAWDFGSRTGANIGRPLMLQRGASSIASFATLSAVLLLPGDVGLVSDIVLPSCAALCKGPSRGKPFRWTAPDDRCLLRMGANRRAVGARAGRGRLSGGRTHPDRPRWCFATHWATTCAIAAASTCSPSTNMTPTGILRHHGGRAVDAARIPPARTRSRWAPCWLGTLLPRDADSRHHQQ